MTLLTDLTPEELAAFVRALGWPDFRARQINGWLVKGCDFDGMTNLPRELIEAARVEGASWFQIYRKVVMPLSGPVLATAAIWP